MRRNTEETMEMKVSGNELLLIYNSQKLWDRRALGYAESLQHHKVKGLDITKDSLSELQLKEICDQLGVEPGELIDPSSSDITKDQLSTEDTLKLLVNDPELLKTPIALFESGGMVVGSSYDFVKGDMANKGVDDRNT